MLLAILLFLLCFFKEQLVGNTYFFFWRLNSNRFVTCFIQLGFTFFVSALAFLSTIYVAIYLTLTLTCQPGQCNFISVTSFSG